MGGRCRVSLKDRKRTKIRGLSGIQGVAEVASRGRLRWFGHLERMNVNDFVSSMWR